MRVRFTKITNDRHRLEVVRESGTTESAELETKSLLQHDFIHLAFESEANLMHSFWGLVAQGRTFLELAGKAETETPNEESEVAMTEMVVGAFTGAEKEGVDPEVFVNRFKEWCEAVGREFPTWLTADLVVRVIEYLRKLRGKWNATPFGETMEVTWSA